MKNNLIIAGDKVLNLDDLIFIQPTKNKLQYHCFFKSTSEILWLPKAEALALMQWLNDNKTKEDISK